MITERDATEILRLAADAGVRVWLDGGWGVDALVGRMTRPHDDVDLFVRRTDQQLFERALTAAGFSERVMHYTETDHTAWQDARGRTIDLHVFEFVSAAGDPESAGDLEAAADILFLGERYPGAVFSGRGTISGMEVSCIEPASQLLFHLGYEHDADDVHDVRLLVETFGFDLPDEYRE